MMRLGRVLHWTFLLFAACAAVFTIVAASANYSAHRRSLAEVAAYKPPPKPAPLPANTKFDAFANDDEIVATNGADTYFDDDAPHVVDFEPAIFWGFLAALGLMLVGRALRYLLAAE